MREIIEVTAKLRIYDDVTSPRTEKEKMEYVKTVFEAGIDSCCCKKGLIKILELNKNI